MGSEQFVQRHGDGRRTRISFARRLGQRRDVGRRRVYRCIETLLELGGADGHRGALGHLYGEANVANAEAMLRRERRFFGITAPGMDLEGCDMHQRLLAAYDKLPH